VAELVLPAIERSGPVEAWIIDDTGFPKKGRHSVGVTRQYCGQLGKQDNCQVAVTLSLANHEASLPVAYRLYLPEDWAKDQARRDKAKIPETIAFQTKPEIALEQIKATRTAGLPQGVVLMDAGYGNDTRLRTEITALGLSYVAGIGPNTSVWPPGAGPLPAQPGKGIGRPPKLLRRDLQHQPISAKALALRLPAEAWQTITWREGAADWLSSRFARQRVRPAHRDTLLTEPRAEEWLLIEWPPEEAEPTKYWFATLPEDIAFERLVDVAKLRWRIERDYQELKQELGLGDYEGRVARLPPPCHPLYCRLRLFDRRTRRHPPLWTTFLLAALGICHSRRLPTQRRRRSDPNGTSPTRSQQSEGASSSRSPRPCRDALAAIRRSGRRREFLITDAVRLEDSKES
jgi:SRSO17 transposase